MRNYFPFENRFHSTASVVDGWSHFYRKSYKNGYWCKMKSGFPLSDKKKKKNPKLSIHDLDSSQWFVAFLGFTLILTWRSWFWAGLLEEHARNKNKKEKRKKIPNDANQQHPGSPSGPSVNGRASITSITLSTSLQTLTSSVCFMFTLASSRSLVLLAVCYILPSENVLNLIAFISYSQL